VRGGTWCSCQWAAPTSWTGPRQPVHVIASHPCLWRPGASNSNRRSGDPGVRLTSLCIFRCCDVTTDGGGRERARHAADLHRHHLGEGMRHRCIKPVAPSALPVCAPSPTPASLLAHYHVLVNPAAWSCLPVMPSLGVAVPMGHSGKGGISTSPAQSGPPLARILAGPMSDASSGCPAQSFW